MNGKTLYTDGTATFTNGSVNIVGDGTLWTILFEGDPIQGPDGKMYEIDTITDDTHISLDRAYEGTTAPNAAYVIWKSSTTRDSVRAISQQLSQITGLYRTALHLTEDQVVVLDKSASNKEAGIMLKKTGDELFEIGAFADDEFAIRYLLSGVWTKALSVDPTFGKVSVLSQLLFGGIIAPPQITADVDDYAPTGLAQANVIKFSTDTSRHLKGLTGGTPGRVVALLNTGEFDLIIDNAAVSSAAGNRFALSSDAVNIRPGDMGLLFYENGWHIMSGAGGGGGDKGWSPVLALITSGVNRVVQVTDWVGGQGLKPTTGLYVGATGLVADIGDAINVRGQNVELQVAGGNIQWKNSDEASWTNLVSLATITGPQGDKGWSPAFAIVTDGERRVLQVASWQGGAGSAPAAPKYVGASGLTDSLPGAIDVRGPVGPTGPAGQGLNYDTAVASIAGRDAYDEEAQDYSVLVIDAGTIYIKMSAASGDWSDPISVAGGNMQSTNNLSDLEDIADARVNLGLGDLATKNKSELFDPVVAAMLFGS